VATVSNPAQPGDSDDPWEAPDPALALALQQLRWYARRRNRARVTYRAIELLLLLMTAATTVAAALKATAWITAVLAASTVVLAGLSKGLDSHDSWVAFGSAWAELQVAVNDYRLLPGEDRGEEARRRLVGQVNEVIRADTGRWASRRRSLAEGQRAS
jgi:Protein of unknown function (DUF4231)